MTDSQKSTESIGDDAVIQLATGNLRLEELTGILLHLPVDITFVDADGCVRFYSDGAARTFSRTHAVIGKNVEDCHSPDSVEMVRQILDAFRTGSKEEASFWLKLKDRFIVVRYHAIRSKAGHYLGCLEISQDVSGIRTLKGEQRHLTWDE